MRGTWCTQLQYDKCICLSVCIAIQSCKRIEAPATFLLICSPSNDCRLPIQSCNGQSAKAKRFALCAPSVVNLTCTPPDHDTCIVSIIACTYIFFCVKQIYTNFQIYGCTCWCIMHTHVYILGIAWMLCNIDMSSTRLYMLASSQPCMQACKVQGQKTHLVLQGAWCNHACRPAKCRAK